MFLKVQIEESRAIEAFREKFDPLFSKVPEHVTLVHPFDWLLGLDVLKAHLESHFFLPKNRFQLGKMIWRDGYASLPLLDRPDLSELRKKLYSGVLSQFFKSDISYTPHITLGRYENDFEENKQREYARVLNFGKEGIFTESILESILVDQSSRVEWQMTL